MEQKIKDYTIAFNNHLKAQQDEMKAKHEVRATYYALMQAKEAMREEEKFLLAEAERQNYV